MPPEPGMRTMNLIWRNTLTVFAKELRDSLRDRRTLISMIVLPTLVIPLIMIAAGTVMTKVMRKAQAEASPIAILGGAEAPAVVAELRADPRFRIVETMDYRKEIAENASARPSSCRRVSRRRWRGASRPR